MAGRMRESHRGARVIHESLAKINNVKRGAEALINNLYEDELKRQAAQKQAVAETAAKKAFEYDGKDKKEVLKAESKKLVDNLKSNYGRELSTITMIQGRRFIKQIQNGNNGLGKSEQFRMLEPLGGVASAIATDITFQNNNKKIIEKFNGKFDPNNASSTELAINQVANNELNLQDLVKSNKILVNERIRFKEQPFTLKKEKDYTFLLKDADRFAIEKGLKKFSLMSKEELKNLVNTSTDSNITHMAQMFIKIKSGKTNGLNRLKNNRKRIKKTNKKLLGRTLDDTYTYKGYATTRQIINITKISLKVIRKPLAVLWKAEKFGGRTIIKATTNVLRTLNLNKAAGVVEFAGKMGSVASGISERGVNLAYNSGAIVKDMMKNAPDGVVVARRAVHDTAEVTKKVASGAVKKLGRTTVGQSRIGRGITKGSKTLGKVGKVAGKAGKIYWKAASTPLRFMNKGIAVVGNIKNFFMNVLKSAGKALGKVLGPALIVIIKAYFIMIGLASIIIALSAVGDAVSKNLEEFKTKTTMGATYDKLLEKEREFNAAVANLINEPVPTGGDYANIKQWTNFNVHYIGPDGKEMFGSSAYGYGTTIEGVGGFNIVINSTSDTIWTFLKKMGWNDYAIAGIMGNIMNECSMNPADGHNQAGRHDIGIVQWTGSRYFKYMAYANANGGAYDVNTQLKYLFVEAGYQNIIQTMGHSNWNSIEDATDYFINNYEKYKNYQTDMRERQERRNAAKSYYDYYATKDQYADIEQDDELIASVGSTAGDYDEATSTSNLSSYGTSTIKGILSMAAVYIDQDFNKYGAFMDGIFTDSVYKDYCAKLYDSTHIIGKDSALPEIYYCPAYSVEVSTDDYAVATESCNNKIPGGSSKDDWINSGTGMDRKYSLSIDEDKNATYEKETDDGTETVRYTKYTIKETGPHGYVTYTYSSGDDDSAETARKKRKEMVDKGCKNMKWFVIDKGDGYTEYAYACACDLCKGHIDGNAYVFISNIYDPTENQNTSSNTDSSTETDDNTNTDDTNDTENTDNKNKTKKQDSYNNVEKRDVETRFSMYALDKYATAFDAPDSSSGVVGTAICPNINCPSYLDEHSGYANVVESEDGTYVCEECGEEIESFTKTKSNHPGDEESVNEANQTENRSAEKAIMDELTGKDIEIKNWWNNESWFTDLSTTKTYFRLYSGEESFDTLEKPEEEDEYGFKNVVNKDNSTPYWFNAFTSKSGRNYDFEKHGWDDDSISMVRLLMAGDWLELYGIQDFGGVTGAPLTDEQLAQLIQNTPEWADLPSDRKAIVYAAQNFQENVAKRYNTRYVYGGGHGSLKKIEQIGAGDTFDCSSYVCTILYNAGLYRGECLTTSGFASSRYFQTISYSQLKPGDILVKGGKHVVLYLGGNKIAHASTSSKPLKDTYNVEGLQYYINQGFTAMRPTFVRENVYDTDNTETDTDYND